MKLIKILTLLLLTLSYLFFSYIRFYHIVGDAGLKSPFANTQKVLLTGTGERSVVYVALGDSLSAGVGSLSTESTFVYQYALNLSKNFQNTELINLAQPGGMTIDIIKYQLASAINANPDYITILIGTNDIHNKVTTKDFKDNYYYILSTLLNNTDAKIAVINIPYLGSSKSVYPPYNYILDFRIKQFNSIIYKLVNSMDMPNRVKYVDLYSATYTTSSTMVIYYSSDYFHPSDEGYMYWGKIINAN